MSEWDALTPEQQATHRAVWEAALDDPEFVAGLERGIADFEAGRVVPWTDVKRRVALSDVTPQRRRLLVALMEAVKRRG